MRSVRVVPIDAGNWSSALGVRVDRRQLRFVADHQPVALVILAKAYVRPGEREWEPLALVDEAGDTIGVVALVHSVDECQIRHLAIDARYQNRGLGGLAMSAIVEHVEHHRPRCRKLSVTFHPDNDPARRLYSRTGFADTGMQQGGEPLWSRGLALEPRVSVASPFESTQTVQMQSQNGDFIAANGRRFAAFPVAVLVFIVNPMSRELLLFESPAKRGREGWEVVSGAVEHGETLIDAVHREVREEAGADIRIGVLGAVHAWNWHYDHLVPNMISAAFVASYLGGGVTPGDDLTGSDFRWASVAQVHQLASAGVPLIPGDVGMFDRALQCFDMWSAVKPTNS